MSTLGNINKYELEAVNMLPVHSGIDKHMKRDNDFFKHDDVIESKKRKTAYQLGLSDYDFNQRNKEKLFNPYPEHSAEYSAYEAAYTHKELSNFEGN